MDCTMTNTGSKDQFERRARAHIEEALPHGSVYEKQKLLEDWLDKEHAAEDIVIDFKKRVGNPSGKCILDLGFGNGITLVTFAKAGAEMHGVEVSKDLYDIATEYVTAHGVPADLHLYNGITFPFTNATFDHIYSVSVLEHVSDPVAVLREAARVLKPGGTFYLAFPNRFNPKETHTGVWFLSYLSCDAAQTILRLLGHNSIPDWNLHFLSYFWLRTLLRKNAINLHIRFEAEHGTGLKRPIKRFLAALGIHHSAVLPHVMVILEKK